MIMDIYTMLAKILTIIIITLLLIGLVVYYFLRKLDKKSKDKYPKRFNGKFFMYHVPRDGEYLCKRYWFWQVEKRKFLEKKMKEEQKARNLSGGIYSRRATKRGWKSEGEKGRNVFLRELFIKIN